MLKDVPTLAAILPFLISLLFAFITYKSIKSVTANQVPAVPTDSRSPIVSDIQYNLLPTGNSFVEQQGVDLQAAIEYEQNTLNPKFHRTKKEENLSFNFSLKYSDEIQRFDDDIYLQVSKIRKIDDIDVKIKQCQKAIDVFYKAKTFCYNKGKGGTIYFQDMWEHLHNSKIPNFSYIDSVEKELLFMTTNYDIANQQLKDKKLKNENRRLIKQFNKHIDRFLLELIEENNGILQTDVYPHFEEFYLPSTKRAIKNLSDNGSIVREKSGSTYKLFINKN